MIASMKNYVQGAQNEEVIAVKDEVESVTCKIRVFFFF